jgi:N6-adenosine-specific RNA methylase IME4
VSALEVAETTRLAELEAVVERGLATFVEVGRALLEIRDARLYRATHGTFNEYCRERWSFSRERGRQLIQAAQVVEALPTTVGIPANEAQARELAPLLPDETTLVETWRELKAEYGADLTASTIKSIVGGRLERDRRLRALQPVETPAPPTGRFRTIVADPPWFLPPTGPRTGNGWPGSEGYCSVLPYPSMSIEEIKALPVEGNAADDAHLYLWTINRYIEDAYDVARAWGFEPSTLITWAKAPRGLGLGGPWVLTTEHVLFCRRGSLRAIGRLDSTWYQWARGRHSAKPEEFFDLVERVSPGAYLELFARRRRPGWDAWGNEVAAA